MIIIAVKHCTWLSFIDYNQRPQRFWNSSAIEINVPNQGPLEIAVTSISKWFNEIR